MTTTLDSYVLDGWKAGTGRPSVLTNATTEEPMAECSTEGIDFAQVLTHARTVRGPALRALTFAERAQMLKDLSAMLP